MKKTPVVLIAFLRADVLKHTLLRLAQCDDVLERDIYVYLSCPRNLEEKKRTDAVLSLVEQIRDERLPNIIIIQRDKNEGAGLNIRYAVSETLKHDAGRAIIIEDDVLVSRTFLRYMDEALDLYERDSRIWCINGYKSPYLRVPASVRDDVFLSPINMAWGWGTWKNRWEKVDFEMRDWKAFKSNPAKMARLETSGQGLAYMIQAQLEGRIDTWDVNCVFNMVNHSLWAVQPRLSLTKNIGFHTVGSVHCAGSNLVLERQRYYDFMPKLIKDIPLPPRELYVKFKYAVMDFRPVGRLYRRLLSIVYRFLPANNSPRPVMCAREGNGRWN